LSKRVDNVSLVAGLAIIGVGALLLLEQEDVIDLSLGVVGAVVAAVIGVILIASGLAEGGDGD
jgi:threonine/homoserine efflux transporter RhtA